MRKIGSQSSIRYWSLIKSWPSYYLQGIDIYNVCFIEILKPLSHVIKSCKRFLRDKFVIYWFENLQQFSVPSRTDDHRWSLTRCFVCIPSNYAIVVYIFCDKNRKTWIGFISMQYDTSLFTFGFVYKCQVKKTNGFIRQLL